MILNVHQGIQSIAPEPRPHRTIYDMPQYFFHLDESGSITKDLEGRDLIDLDTARDAAIVAARDVMGGELARGTLRLACYIDIANADGQLLMRVGFSIAVEVTRCDSRLEAKTEPKRWPRLGPA